jgi:hypothetical protein
MKMQSLANVGLILEFLSYNNINLCVITRKQKTLMDRIEKVIKGVLLLEHRYRTTKFGAQAKERKAEVLMADLLRLICALLRDPKLVEEFFKHDNIMPNVMHLARIVESPAVIAELARIFRQLSHPDFGASYVVKSFPGIIEWVVNYSLNVSISIKRDCLTTLSNLIKHSGRKVTGIVSKSGSKTLLQLYK